MRSMKILCLYNNDCALELFEWLSTQGHETMLCSEKLSPDWCWKQLFDLAVSYTYRYIINKEVLKALNFNVVNIHNAYLPWNRGADPNLWSILDNTPRGVTLHYVNDQLDKGSIIAQVVVNDVRDDETLETTYERLDLEAKSLFKNAFAYYDCWKDMRKESCSSGSYHRLADSSAIKDAIGSYKICIYDLKVKYAEIQNRILGGVASQDVD